MSSLGFAQWATGVRNRMANDPGRADFKDQVQCHGHLFLHEYLDDLLNGPRPENVIEFTKTPGRNKTASKRTRAANASAQKVKPVMPLSFVSEPLDKENVAATASKQPQAKGTSRFQHTLFTARETPSTSNTDDGPHTRDSISRATPSRPGVPVFNPTPVRAPLDDPLSPFRDADLPEKEATTEQPIEKVITPQQIFTAKLVIQSSSPVAERMTSVVTGSSHAETTTPQPEPQVAEVDLSIIQEDDEGNSIGVFEDARDEFSRPASTAAAPGLDEEEADITEATAQKGETHVAVAVASPQKVVPKHTRAPSLPPIATLPQTSLPTKAISSPVEQPLAPAQRLPSPPTSEDTPAPSPTHTSPAKVTELALEPVEVTSNAVPVITEPEPVSAPAPAPISTTSQPTPPPESTSTTAPAPPPISRTNSQNQILPAQTQTQTQPAQIQTRPTNPGRGLNGFTGPSLKELRREPSVSGAAHRELRQSSWRKKPDGTVAPAPAASASTEEPGRLKRKSSVLTKPGTSKHQRRHSSSSRSGSSDDEQTELQVPLKDEDSTSGSGWNSGGSMLDDLRNRLARLEKSTNGKTPAASRIWGGTTGNGSGTTPVLDTAELPSSAGERRMSLSDLGVPDKPTGSQPQAGTISQPSVFNPLAVSIDATSSAPNESILSNRTTTPDNSPPPIRRVLPAPPVFALPSEPPALAAASTQAQLSSEAVRANAKAEAARFFAGGKFAPPTRNETQSTVATEVESVFDTRSQVQSQSTQGTAPTQSLFGLEGEDLIDFDGDVDIDGEEDGEADGDLEDETKVSDQTPSLASSTTQTRSMVKKGPVKSIQLAAAAAKKAAEEQDRKTTRMKEMEERRQAAALRKADEDRAKSTELEKKRKDREELAASKSVKPVVKKAQEDPNKKRKVEAEKKPVEVKKPMGSSVFKDTAATKSRIVKPTAGPSASSSQPQLKSALKSTTNPFAPPPSATKTIKHAGSSSNLKNAASSVGKKAKGSISDAPGQALQAQMQARVQAQLKAVQNEPEVQSESIELPDINSEYSDSDDEDRGKDLPEWAQSPELNQALRDQETFNPDAIFGPIQPLKMGDLFKTGHSRFRKRTSSANWAGTDGITVEEEIEYARRMGYRN